MEAQRRPYLTPHEYLAIERRSEIKSEYLDGEIFARSGSSRKHNLTVVNLTREISSQLIVEVLSPTTEAYDRGKKFEHYQTIEPLMEYVLVAQDQPRVEHYLRQDGNRWLLTTLSGLDSKVSLPSIQCELSLVEIYKRIEFGT